MEKIDWFFLMIMVMLSIILGYANLGDRYYGMNDEAYSALQSKGILSTGLPVMDDNFDLETKGVRLDNLNTWLSYYVTALGFLFFGITNFAGRFWFVFFGIFTIVVFYFFSFYLTKERKIASIATLLLATSVIFYLHIRQSRYYSLAIFFSICLLYSYIRYVDSRSSPSMIMFIFSAVFLFYAHIEIFFYVFVGIVMHIFYVHISKKRKISDTLRTWFFPAISISVLTIPWIIYWIPNLTSNATYHSPWSVILSLSLGIYYYLILFFPLPLAVFFYSARMRKALTKADYYPIYFVILSVLLVPAIISHNPYPSVRKMIMVLPLFIILISLILDKIQQKFLSLGILLVLIFSNLLFIAPFYPLRIAIDEQGEVGKFIYRSTEPHFTLLSYLKEIIYGYESATEEVIKILDAAAYPHQIIASDLLCYQVAYYLPNPVYCFESTQSFEKIASKDPDWIILSASYNSTVDTQLYDQIILQKLYVDWMDHPDTINHAFADPKQGKALRLYKRAS